jgi:hypothetical protein
VPNDRHDAFREGLLEAVGKSAEEWEEYHSAMKDYRDQLAAHHDLDAKPTTIRPSTLRSKPRITTRQLPAPNVVSRSFGHPIPGGHEGICSGLSSAVAQRGQRGCAGDEAIRTVTAWTGRAWLLLGERLELPLRSDANKKCTAPPARRGGPE